MHSSFIKLKLDFRAILGNFGDFEVMIGICIMGNCPLRAALHLEAGPIRCVRGFKSSLVIGQKIQIGPKPFTPRGRADLVVWFF